MHLPSRWLAALYMYECIHACIYVCIAYLREASGCTDSPMLRTQKIMTVASARPAGCRRKSPRAGSLGPMGAAEESGRVPAFLPHGDTARLCALAARTRGAIVCPGGARGADGGGRGACVRGTERADPQIFKKKNSDTCTHAHIHVRSLSQLRSMPERETYSIKNIHIYDFD